MAVYKLTRLEVRPDARDEAERAMHDYATYVRNELADFTWTTYRDPAAPAHYVAMSRAENAAADERARAAPGTVAFTATLSPLLVGSIELTACELVTSSDLAPRPRDRRRR